MPGQGVASMFKFGQAVGTISGVLAALSIPTLYVAPATWKRHHTLPAAKEICRQRAIECWPTHAVHFARKKDHGRAEASFIALWGVHAAAVSGGER
jgi:crossover junction endodeoxyribonuclease RuvC